MVKHDCEPSISSATLEHCRQSCRHAGLQSTGANSTQDRSLGLQGLAREALTLLEGALALWPATPVKLHYIEKLIQTNQAANVDPPPALIIGGRTWQLAHISAMADLSRSSWQQLCSHVKSNPCAACCKGLEGLLKYLAYSCA